MESINELQARANGIESLSQKLVDRLEVVAASLPKNGPGGPGHSPRPARCSAMGRQLDEVNAILDTVGARLADLVERLEL